MLEKEQREQLLNLITKCIGEKEVANIAKDLQDDANIIAAADFLVGNELEDWEMVQVVAMGLL